MKYFFIPLLLIAQFSIAQDLSKWKYQQLLAIENTSATHPLIDYQVGFTLNTKALIKSGKMKADGSDIRLIAEDGKQTICHWIEGSIGTKETRIWLKIDRVEQYSTQQVYLLYGNPQAQAISDPECVFNLFEDFNQAALDRQKWDTFGNGELKIEQGVAHIQAADADHLLRTKQAFDMPIIAEAFLTKAEGKRITLSIIQDAAPLWAGYTLSWDGWDREMYLNVTDTETSPCGGFSFFKDLFGMPATNPEGQWSIAWLTKNQVFAQWPEGSLNEGNTLLHFKPLKVAIGVTACSDGLDFEGNMEVDWIRIRKLALNPPNVSLQAIEKNSISGVATPLNLMG